MIATLCPEAAEKLDHAVRRMSPMSGSEEWSAAALSCRRMLKDIADKLYPSRATRIGDRKLGDEQYKNRLWAWILDRKHFARDGLVEQIEWLCAQLDALYDASCKGVHADVTREQAEHCVVQSYMVAASLAELHDATDTRQEDQLADFSGLTIPTT
jgi:hypothetical protein